MIAAELVHRGARRFGERTAVRFEGRELSFREVEASASRFAHVLQGVGASKGDRVALLVGNELWSIPLDFACLTAGLVRVPLNPRLAAEEQVRMLEETEPRLLVHSPELVERAEELLARTPGLVALGLGCRGAGGGLDLLAAAEQAASTRPAVHLEPSDPMLLLFTSGTTGRLKAVEHTQGSYAAICANILANLLSPGPDSVMLHAASLIHASGTFVLPYWIRGGAAAVLRHFEPEAYLAAIERERASEVNLVPTMLAMLLQALPDHPADLSSLRLVVYGASPMPRPVLREAMDRLGPKFRQYYGQTEAPLCISVLDERDHQDPSLLGSCGQPAVDAQVRLADDQGQPVAPGEIGEVQVKAPFQMAGYHRAPELNAEMHTPDGWLRTRDLAREDEQGYLTLVDRASDMIVTGGYNVYPREVEDVLLAHPAVAECAVVGAPDPTWVEAVVAFVVPAPGRSADEDELRSWVRAQLAGYKVPKRIEFVDGIPKSAVGKVLRRALRDPLWADR
ncbi:class I adenylate-forming enzyme family protein [Aciditerrimonas ferrireducens]|jgi:acyl-CoA synthetase (AMP-forming)/AMP-acid ligase II|uniref:Class I adenylate-forming enzyme family protein n=1 Tax=Aciditerrimonas ferrireducens TaxID=667306 RepID=A0ABV6C2C9_9ACTN|nr:AMP-binding protein [Aciditerrimonas ferrireducens]MCK4177005.1 AMP-binding protein [Aciditerrimonas ferrireducens]